VSGFAAASQHTKTTFSNRNELEVSAETIQRVVHEVGGELAQRREAAPKSEEALAQRPEEPPELAGREERLPDTSPTPDFCRGSAAGAAEVFLRSEARGKDRGNRGPLGG
jgi:hypothetical protein